jgi:26S proteasome regulatory subunit N1
MSYPFSRDIEVMEPKCPEDSSQKKEVLQSSSLDSARQNLGATFVNAFVNAEFGQAQDKLKTAPTQIFLVVLLETGWIFKSKERGKASAAASLRMILPFGGILIQELPNLTNTCTVTILMLLLEHY